MESFPYYSPYGKLPMKQNATHGVSSGLVWMNEIMWVSSRFHHIMRQICLETSLLRHAQGTKSLFRTLHGWIPSRDWFREGNPFLRRHQRILRDVSRQFDLQSIHPPSINRHLRNNSVQIIQHLLFVFLSLRLITRPASRQKKTVCRRQVACFGGAYDNCERWFLSEKHVCLYNSGSVEHFLGGDDEITTHLIWSDCFRDTADGQKSGEPVDIW